MTTCRPSSLKPLTLPHVSVTNPCSTSSRFAWQTAVFSFLNIGVPTRGMALSLACFLADGDQVFHDLVQLAGERAGAEGVVQRAVEAVQLG